VDCSGGAGWRWFGRCRIAQSPRDDLGDRRALQESCGSDVASPREAASEPRHCGPASWVVSTRSRRTMRVPHSAVRLGVPIVVAMTFAMFPPSASSSTRAAMAASCQSYGLRVSNGPGRACWVAVRVGACRNARPRQRVVRRALPRHHGGAVPRSFRTLFAPGETSMCGLFRVAPRTLTSCPRVHPDEAGLHLSLVEEPAV
jgi:hypothetical protein